MLVGKMENSVAGRKKIMMICIKCGQNLPLDKFAKNKPSKYGRMRYCIPCRRDYELTGNKTNIVLSRDGYKCQTCGMTNQEHINRWGKKLTIDHIDGNGRNAKMSEKNNNLKNLITLCLICHGKKDNRRTRANPQGVRYER